MAESEFKMIAANIGNMGVDVDLITNRDTAPCVRISIDSVYHSTYLTMQQVNNLVNTLTIFLDRVSASEKETSESLLNNFLEENMEVCNVTPSDAPALLYELIDADIASPNKDGYYWASIAGKTPLTLFPICYIKDDEDGWILPACLKSKVEWWHPKKLKTKFEED